MSSGTRSTLTIGWFRVRLEPILTFQTGHQKVVADSGRPIGLCG
jgi:hypothetical protein